MARAALACGLSPVVVRDTLTVPQIVGIVAEYDRHHAERDLASLEIVHAAVAPTVNGENKVIYDRLAARLRRIAHPPSAKAAARSMFARYRERADRAASRRE